MNEIHGSWVHGRRRFVAFALLIVLMAEVNARALMADQAEFLAPDQFGSLVSLEEAVQRALKNEAEVKRAFARLKKEESLYKGSISEFLPKLSTEIFQAAATGERKSVTYLDAGVEQPLFQGGKILAGKRKHKVRMQGEELKFEGTRLDVELAVRILYVQVLKEKELTRIAQNQVKELSLEQERIKHLVDKEILPRYDFFRVETLLESAKHSLVKHKETYDYLFGVLRETVGVKEDESLDLEPPSDFPELEEDVFSYLDIARKHDPVYRLKDLRIQEKTFEKKELQADRFPHISLAAKWNRSRDVFVDTDRALVGIQGTWNIWDFGRLGNKIKAKSYEIEESKWTGEIEVREHEKEIRKFFHEARAAFQNIRLAEALVRERKEIYKNEKTKLVAGEKGSGELVDSFIALEEAKNRQVEAVMQYRILLARLERNTAFQAITGQSWK